MGTDYLKAARGIRKVSPVVTVAAAATPENLYLVSVGATVGRTVIVRKIMCYSVVGNCVVQIGIGLAPLVPIFPFLYVINLFDTEWMEDEIPEVELNQNITVQSDILGVQVQVEVEEIGS